MASISSLSVVRQPSLPDDDNMRFPIEEADVDSGSGSEPRESRKQSTIEFPYGDLDDSIAVVKAIFDNGGDHAELSSLYAWLGHKSVISGAFRMRISAARLFGLITVERQRVELAPLGIKMLDASTNRQARVEAFLNVPLYAKIFERYKGRVLPRDAGLESEMVSLGVTPKQKERARQAFQRSATQAGFFAYGQDKLIVPNNVAVSEIMEQSSESDVPETVASAASVPVPAQPATVRVTPRTFGGGGVLADTHPLVIEAVRTLPAPGEELTNAELNWWVRSFKEVLRIAYRVKPDDED